MPRSSPARAILLALVFAGTDVLAETATIRGVSRIYLRTGPGTSHEPNGVVVEGEPLNTLEQSGSWVKVETADGRVGYVYSGYLVVGETGSTQAAGAETPPAGAAGAEAPPVAAAPTAVPAAPPAVFAVPDHESTVEANAGDGLREEIAVLKAEVERLKSEVASGSSDVRGGTAAVPSIGAENATSARATSRRTSSPRAGEESLNLRIAGVALFSFVLGWIFGAGFSRRRSRATRGRLRF